jgi:hypothetical protein
VQDACAYPERRKEEEEEMKGRKIRVTREYLTGRGGQEAVRQFQGIRYQGVKVCGYRQGNLFTIASSMEGEDCG